MTSLDHLPADVQTALAQDLTIDITTTGRRSGKARRIEIWFMNIEGSIYIAGTPGPRDWLANLTADPEFVFHLKESATADLPATAQLVEDAAERQRVFEAASASWYSQQGADVQALVDTAPLVHITFDG